jgi:uncharacterized protein YmfQ (DUF2313 family)
MPFEYTLPIGGDFTETVYDASAYARQLKALLPPGKLWNLAVDSVLSKVCLALGDEFARVDGRGADLIEESDPRTAYETLDDWERVLGLPDAAVTVIPTTPEARRLAITQKYIGVGGQSAAYYEQLAAACGYTVTVDDAFGSLVLRSGFRSGARCYGTDWAFVWQVNVSPPAGDALTHEELEAIIRRVSPAHTTVIFVYL